MKRICRKGENKGRNGKRGEGGEKEVRERKWDEKMGRMVGREILRKKEKVKKKGKGQNRR